LLRIILLLNLFALCLPIYKAQANPYFSQCRAHISQAQIGSKHKYCLGCDKQIENFNDGESIHGICPHCHSKSRSRAYFAYANHILQNHPSKNPKILEIGPNKATVMHLNENPLWQYPSYTAIDVRALPYHDTLTGNKSFVKMDATQMGFTDQQFDIVIASNVLEYIPDIESAIKEISRVLKTGGIAIIKVDRSNSTTMSTQTYLQSRSVSARELEIIQEDGRAWFFGHNEFIALLQQHRLQAQEVEVTAGLTDEVLKYYGLKPGFKLIIATKQ